MFSVKFVPVTVRVEWIYWIAWPVVQVLVYSSNSGKWQHRFDKVSVNVLGEG